MAVAEHFRKMAANWLGKAQAASDPNTSAGMHRVSDAWTALAQQAERDARPLPYSAGPVRLPADLPNPRSNINSQQIADVLRDRLHLINAPSEDSIE